MKKILSKFSSYLLIITMLTGFANWSGTKIQVSAEELENTASFEENADDFIPVYTIEDLYNIRNDLDANYRLMNDIDLTEATAEDGDWNFMGNGWNPIGSNNIYGDGVFTGVFDGGGHSIIGMRINVTEWPIGKADTVYLGLFAQVSGEIRDLHMVSGEIKNIAHIIDNVGYPIHHVYAGSIAGKSKATITNCSSTIGVCTEATNSTTGGLVGDNSGVIINCYNTGSISVDISSSHSSYVGGIAAASSGGEIRSCYNKGNISALAGDTPYLPKPCIGGILGCGSTKISNCSNSGNIYADASGSQIGGIAGTIIEQIRNCFNTGSVSSLESNSSIGGIVGSTSSSVMGCFNTGSISSDGLWSCYTGGIVGRAVYLKIINCYNTGETSSCDVDTCMGGIVGCFDPSTSVTIGSISDCYNRGSTIAGNMSGGGILGKGGNVTITDSYYLAGTGTNNRGSASLTETQMKLKSIYQGFDFNEIWIITPCSKYPYPQLRENLQEPANHIFGNWQVRTQATCTEKGLEYRTCTACGEEETREISALGHSFTQYTYNNDATCTENGTETAKCDRCDVTDARIIDNSALGHDYSEEWTIDKEATCTESGSKSHHCTRCDEKTDITEIPATGHSFVWVVDTPATEDAPGVQHEECSICGYKQNENTEIPQLPHVHTGITHHEAVTATCHQPGTIEYWTCSSDKCAGKYYSDANCTAQITTITTAIDPNNHDGGTEIKNAVKATCNTDGYTGDTYCLGCGTLLSKGTVIAATGHTGVVTKEAKAPTCTEAGWTEEIRCSICDEILQPSEPIAALGHSFTNYISDNNATCTENGTETAICDRCDATDTREIENSAFGHDYHEKRVEPGYSHEGMIQQVCARCDDVSSSVSIPALIIEETLADVANGQWFTPYIAYCLDTELMKGQGDKDAAGREYFRPENSMTRAELVTVLYNMEGQPPVQFEAIFDDVTSEKWFATQVTWASQNGLVFGTADKIFEPDTPISRQDLATILYRYAVDYKGIEMNVENVDALLGAFSDADRVGNYAKVAMAAMNQAGVITGDGDRLKPQENATRAEVASMLSRYLPNVLQADQTNG